MAVVKINWNPDEKILGQFSEFGMFFLGLVAAPLALYRDHTTVAIVLWATAILLRLVSLTKLAWIRPVFIGLSVITWPIGWVVSHVALAIVYYGVFTPLALFFWLIGRDALNRKFDPDAESYWEPYNPDQGPARYLRQF